MKLTNKVCLLLFACLAFPAFINAQTETTIKGDIMYAKILNGLNVIIMQQPTNNIEVTFFIKVGSAYESDSLSGIGNVVHNIIADKISNQLHSNKSALTLDNTGYQEYCNTEQSVFKINTNNANLSAVLYMLRDSVFKANITRAELSKAIIASLKQLEQAKYDKKKVFEAKALENLYKQDHDKFEVLGNSNTVKSITLLAAKKFYEKYYVSNNSIGTITGNITPSVVRDQTEGIFNTLIKSEFNPQNITQIVDLRPMAYTTQFVVEDSSKKPEFQMWWQFPGTSENAQLSYCGYLLNAMLNDANNFIRVKAVKLGCRDFTVTYEANNFSGIFKIAFQPSSKNFFETYNFINREMGRLDKTLLNETMMNAGKLKFKKEYEDLKKSKQYPEWIVKHWAFNDENYFPSLLDSVMRVSENSLKDFIVNNFDQSAHVTGLRISKADRDSMKTDQLFTDLDENVAKYVFKYRQNITDIEQADDLAKRDNLLQWLNINSDVNVQVNGFSDEHEYNRASDDSVLQFMDSIPTFRQLKTDIVKKGYIRPEMMRSMKIVKYLYDHGIAANRLSGTSMVYKSSNKKEAIDNMKCTLTLNKYRNSPSLYEFHYGKKTQ